MTETFPEHVHEVGLCPACGGLVAQRLDHIGPVTGGEIRWADGRTTAIGSAELYVGKPDPGCGRAGVDPVNPPRRT